MATAIIKRRLGTFDPSTFRDSYQEGLKQLIEAKLKGLPLKTQPARALAPVIDLMTALKRSLAQDMPPQPKQPKSRASKDRRQTNLLLPVAGKGRATQPSPTAVPAPRPRRKKA